MDKSGETSDYTRIQPKVSANCPQMLRLVTSAKILLVV